MNTRRWRDQAFIAYLQRLASQKNLEGHTGAEARSALAALRRGLGKPLAETAEMYKYVDRWLPLDASQRQEDTYYLVASLFALHQASWQTGSDAIQTNLGASLRQMAERSANAAGVERRFVALLNSHMDDLPDHLRRIVMLLKTTEVPIDWMRLLYDIQQWNNTSRTVQRNWARAYWAESAALAVNDIADATTPTIESARFLTPSTEH